MDYAALKIAAQGRGSNAEAAAALAAQVTPRVRDVPTFEARALLLATGEWGAIKILSRTTPSVSVPAEIVAAAIVAVDTLELTENLETTKTTYWVAIQTLLGALLQAGVISAGTHAALLALRDVEDPIWSPAPSEHDIAFARSI